MIELVTAEALSWLKTQPDDRFNLTFTSPPYEDCRTYGMGFKLKGQAWVDWLVPIIQECLRVTNGLVAFVVQGKTKKFRWSATPALLMADLHRAGVCLRKPLTYHRHGIPGGSPDFPRGDSEFVVCCTNGGRLPWSDMRAMGHPCKYKTGGAFSYRTRDGARENTKRYLAGRADLLGHRRGRPEITKPGDVIHCKVGKGRMGHDLCHENEAPFSEKLCEFFIRSFCPEGGWVLDPFSGSATAVCVAEKFGRNGVGVDIRESQTEIGRRRLAEITPKIKAA